MSYSKSTYLTSDLPNHSISRISMSSPSPVRSAVTFSNKTPTSSLKTRQYSSLDPKPAVAEYTTFYSTPLSRSTQTLHDTTTTSGSLGFSTSSQRTPVQTTTQSSVISAFRDLQAKVKVIEQERFDSLRERDEVRAVLLDKRRRQQVEHSRHEMQTTESLVALQSHHERMRREYENIQQRLRAAEEIQQSLTRKQVSQQQLYTALQSDLDRNRDKYVSLERNLVSLKRDLIETDVRCDQVEETALYTSPTKQGQQRSLIADIDAVEQKTLALRSKQAKLASKVQSMESYIELLVKINGELCETLHAREAAKRRLQEMSRSLSPPPRYTWPKEVSYSGVMQVINEAARATAQAAVESSTLHATEQAMKNVVHALTPPRRRVVAPYGEVNSDDDDDDEESELHVMQRTPRSRSRSPFAGTRSMTNGLSSMSLQEPAKRKIAFQDEAPPKLRESQLRVSDDSDEDSSSTFETPQVKKTIKKLNKKSAGKKAPSSPVGSALSTTSNRQRSLKTVLARQGAITSATRLAAAAQAASTAVKVASHAPSSRHSNRSRSAPREPRADFIPAGGAKSSEFNVVASVSKASRAASTLNATIASRVKSLHNAGAGNIFDEVPRVELIDMQHQLAAVKKMRESLTSLR